MRTVFGLFVGITLSMSAFSSDNPSEKSWAYAELIHALNTGGTGALSALETGATKCGFGPGEEGPGCIRRVLDTAQACKEEVVLALKQGCAMIGTSECISPPQAEDSSILYAGPRVHLAFAESGKSLTVLSLVCGGD